MEAAVPTLWQSSMCVCPPVVQCPEGWSVRFFIHAKHPDVIKQRAAEGNEGATWAAGKLIDKVRS